MGKSAAEVAISYLNLNASKSGVVRTAEGKAYKAESVVLDILRALPPEGVADFKSALKSPLEDISTGRRLISDIVKFLATRPSPVADPELEHTFLAENCVTPMSRLKVILVWSDPESVYLYDPETNLMSACSAKLAKQNAARALGKEPAEDWWRRHLVECQRTQYNPTQKSIYTEGHETLWNPFRPAAWTKAWEPPTAPIACPSLLKEFLERFAPDKKDRVLIAAWLRDMVFDFAKPVLVLAGAAGVGKNLLIDHLGKALVGADNSRIASRGFKNSRFTGEIAGKRLFFYDEMILNAEMRELFKSLHNRSASVERKFENVDRVEDLFCSLVIANNFPGKIELEYSDRKFFVPRLSETPIIDSWGQGKIDEFTDAIERPEFLQDVAGYLWHKFKPGQCENFGKSEAFKKLCLNQYPLYFQRIINYRTEQEIDGTKFNKHYKHRIDGDKLREYITHYETQFKDKLATVEGYGSRWHLTYTLKNGATPAPAGFHDTSEFKSDLHA